MRLLGITRAPTSSRSSLLPSASEVMEVFGRAVSSKVTLCLPGRSPCGIIDMRLFFLSAFHDRPKDPPFVSVRGSSPDFRGREESLIRGCFFCGAVISRVGAVVMISGAVSNVRTCGTQAGERGMNDKQNSKTGETYVAGWAEASRQQQQPAVWPWSRAASRTHYGNAAWRTDDVWGCRLVSAVIPASRTVRKRKRTWRGDWTRTCHRWAE